jgi:hypothetical protein
LWVSRSCVIKTAGCGNSCNWCQLVS